MPTSLPTSLRGSVVQKMMTLMTLMTLMSTLITLMSLMSLIWQNSTTFDPLPPSLWCLGAMSPFCIIMAEKILVLVPWRTTSSEVHTRHGRSKPKPPNRAYPLRPPLHAGHACCITGACGSSNVDGYIALRILWVIYSWHEP